MYGKHTTLYLRFERMKRRRGKHTTCIIDVELLFFFSFFLELSNFDCLFGGWEWSALTFSFAFVYTCVFIVCVAGELKLKCVFIFYYFFLVDQWEFDTLICLYHAILANNVFGYFSCYLGKSKWKLGPSLGATFIYGQWVVLVWNLLTYHVQVGVDLDHKFTIMGGCACVCVWDMTQIISLIILVSCVFKHGYVLFIQKEKH